MERWKGKFCISFHTFMYCLIFSIMYIIHIRFFLNWKKYSDPVTVHNPLMASHLTLSKSLTHSDGPKGPHDLTLSSAISYPISFLAILSLVHSAPVILVFTLFCRHAHQSPTQNFCPCCFPLPLKLFTWLTPSLSSNLTSSAIFSVRLPLPLSYLEMQLLISLSPHPA